GHRTKPVGHHVEKVSKRRFAQALLVIAWRMFVSPRRDHAVAVAETGMARGAVNIETLASARQRFLIDGDFRRHVVPRVRADFAGIEIRIFVKFTPRNRPFNGRTLGPEVGIKIAQGKRLEARLVVHPVAPAAEEKQHRSHTYPRKTAQKLTESCHQLGTSATETGFKPSRNWRVRMPS